jgi:pyruvate/2-oxoglutarate dehydrogenase complex dihydrolipoamide dehydrogenase (E3) component
MVVGSFSTSVDVAIIGGGPAGLAAAIESQSRGRSVAVVMHGGGSRLARGGPDPLLAACHALEIDLLDGDAVLDGDRQLRIPGNLVVPRLRFRRLILAPDLAPAGDDPAALSVWSRELAEHAPPSPGAIAHVHGDGPAACAAAARLAALGWTVRLMTGETGPLPAADAPVRAAVAAMLHRAGVDVLRPAVAAAAAGEADPPALTITGEKLVARVAGLGLEDTAVQLEGGRIVVDGELRTADPRILAAGAAISGPAAEGCWIRQGVCAAATAAGEAEPYDPALPLHMVPLGAAGFAAWCGLTTLDDPGAPVAVGTAGDLREGGDAGDDDDTDDAATPAAECRLLLDGGGLIAGASLVARGADPAAAAELLLAVEMAAEPGDLAGIARCPGDIAAVAVDRAARAALVATAT